MRRRAGGAGSPRLAWPRSPAGAAAARGGLGAAAAAPPGAEGGRAGGGGVRAAAAAAPGTAAAPGPVQLQGRGRGRARRPGCGCREAPGAGARRQRGSGRRAASCDFSFVVAATRVCFLGRCGRCFPAAPALCPAPPSRWFHPSSFPECFMHGELREDLHPPPPSLKPHTHPGAPCPHLRETKPQTSQNLRGSAVARLGRVGLWSGCLRAIAVLGAH